jgi:hypothetical protein
MLDVPTARLDRRPALDLYPHIPMSDHSAKAIE